MKDNLVNRAITALSGAGFDVLKFSRKSMGPLKLKVIPGVSLIQDGVCVQTMGVDVQNNKLVYDVAFHHPQSSLDNSIVQRSSGETCDLVRYLGAADWRHALSLTQEVIRAGKTSALNVGDFIMVKFDVPAASYDGVNFPARHIDAKAQIIEVEDDKIIFNFDEIIFKSAINAKDKNEGGFSASALAKYLNNEFLDAMGISDVLLPNHDGLEISLLTAFELFGDGECWAPESNYQGEPHQIEYFKDEKNRVKSWEKETHWYWTSSVRASSSNNFCIVSGGGNSSSYDAYSVGGVAPAFCVA